jgi:hypothetical protein
MVLGYHKLNSAIERGTKPEALGRTHSTGFSGAEFPQRTDTLPR